MFLFSHSGAAAPAPEVVVVPRTTEYFLPHVVRSEPRQRYFASRLQNFLGIQPEGFNEDTYDYSNEVGGIAVRVVCLKMANSNGQAPKDVSNPIQKSYMRWRYKRDEEGNVVLQTICYARSP